MCKCCEKSNVDSHVDPKDIRLQEKIEAYKAEKGALIPVLQEAQEIYGYLPETVMKKIATDLKIPVAEVFGVATFYSQFRLTPTGQNIIRVCMGTACHVRGALKVLKTLERTLGIKAGETTGDSKFTLETVSCIGACGLAPVISVNNKVFGNMTPQMVTEILEKYE
jgi:NADH-quinone oxidoreductase subunit E